MGHLGSHSKMFPASWVLCPSEAASHRGGFWEDGAFHTLARARAPQSDRRGFVLLLTNCGLWASRPTILSLGLLCNWAWYYLLIAQAVKGNYIAEQVITGEGSIAATCPITPGLHRAVLSVRKGSPLHSFVQLVFPEHL